MKKDEAKQIIKDTFEHEFNEDIFLVFVKNLFKDFNENNFEPTVKNSFKSFISRYKIIGNFKDSAENNIDILEVILSKNISLERSRTAQRNFIADYLATNNKEAALVVFVLTDNKEDWRFSFVRLEHSLEVSDNKLKTREEVTPAKRWSFLVGKHEGSHTAQSRFVDLLINDKEPNLAELESAFDIEIVTKEFFDKYTELFFQFKEKLDELLEKDETIKKDFKEKDISTVDFAKKTLGQIVFLYFLQKKGWFGVPADKKWGEGPKKFIRALFERRKKYGNNFFNDVLEPLFYEALAQDRGKESIYPRLNNCRMPFLNGGLFEPMNDYKWETTNIVIPDELFSNNIKTKQGDCGTGILDVFDRYNFTVNENEPLEKEVAVDPEMLGKVFENLLDIKDRKSKGAFYTPREIVHYMCQESLINYLETETKNKIPKEDLDFFIHKGERIIENDKMSLEKTEGGKYLNDYYKVFTPDSIKTNAILLNELLKNIKVADPAVGSGAFPLGMINEIVRARKVLNIYINEDISDYELKKYTITHSIYGVDIDPGAVDIAKLRLWLALVVDEDTPHPLPNLEHKIMQGNSLISEYEGIKLFDDSILEDVQIIKDEKDTINKKISLLQKEYVDFHKNKQLTDSKKIEIEKEIKLFQRRLKDLINKSDFYKGNASIFDIPEKRKIAQEKTIILQRKIEEYISESRRTQKQNLKEEIDNLKWDLIEVSLEEQNKLDKLADIKKLRHENIKPFFVWKLEFSDVFKEKKGFDIVIGNPPYISFGLRGVGKMDSKYKEYLKRYYSNSAEYKISLYAIFMELAIQLNNPRGNSTYIIPDSFLLGRYFSKIRKYIMKKCQIINLMLIKARVFENATVGQSVVYLFQKGEYSDKNVNIILVNDKKEIDTSSFIKNKYSQDYFNYVEYNRFRMLFDKATYDLVIKMDSVKNRKYISNFIKFRSGLISKIGQDKIKSDHKVSKMWSKGIFSGGSVSKYFINSKEEFLCYDHSIIKSGGINTVAYFEPKLFVRQTGDSLICSYDDQNLLAINNVHIGNKISQNCDIKFVAAIINSKLLNFYYKNTSLEDGRVMAQVDIEVLDKLPIPEISLLEQKIFVELVDQILKITYTYDYDPKNIPVRQKELEKQIDQLVYKLYDLTSEEIEIVENKQY